MNKKISIYKQVFKIWKLSINKRKSSFIFLIFVILCSGIAESLPLALAGPFLSIVTDPEKIWEISIFQPLIKIFNITNAPNLLFPVTISFCLIIILGAITRLFSLWLNYRFAAVIGHDISSTAFKKILYMSYEEHLETNSSTVLSALMLQVLDVIEVINASLLIITGIFISSCLLIGMLLVDYRTTIFLLLIFSLLYLWLSNINSNKLRDNGKIVALTRNSIVKTMQEALGAIRDIIIDGTHRNFLNRYNKSDFKMRTTEANSYIIYTSPKFILEATGLIVICISAYLLSEDSRSTAIPIIGSIALGAQKLLPAMQSIYSSRSAIINRYESIDKLIYILEKRDEQHPSIIEKKYYSKEKFKSISLNSISYKYPGTSKYILSNINLEIKAGETIGIIGKTGSGKSTLTDIIMGLLKPSEGNILVNNKDISDDININNLQYWRNQIAHVPQYIYISDSSILSNIALGYPEDKIDIERAIECCKTARINEYINSIPDKFDTVLGERGVKLSGGQIQRLGIARALYKGSKVLILDEATSALDTKTEDLIVESIKKMSLKITVITIAHRLNTLNSYNRLIKVENNHIVEIKNDNY